MKGAHGGSSLGVGAAMALVLASCGGTGGGRNGDSGPVSSIGSLSAGESGAATDGNATEGAGESQGGPGTGGQDATSADPSGADDATNFDLGVQPDASPSGCGDRDDGAYQFSYIWIANSPDGTVSKINTETGVEEGRYYTAPAQSTGSPSRTSVNLLGDVAVSNRDPGSTTKIAAELSRCVDNNGNGLIDTSTNGVPMAYAEDECILWNLPIPSAGNQAGPRPTAWEGAKNPDDPCVYDEPRLWIGYKDAANNGVFLRVDGETGVVLDTVMGPAWGAGYGPYGGAVNAEGDLWVTGLGSSHALLIDALTLTVTNVGPPPGGSFYGMAVAANGDLWAAGGATINHFRPATGMWVTLPLNAGSARGIQIDQDGTAWVALNSPCGIATVDTTTDTITNHGIPLPGCSVPVGISIDRDQFVWVVDRDANLAYKVDPASLAVQLTFTALSGPYTYSDMTGSGLNLVVNPPG